MTGGTLSEELKWGLLVSATILLLAGGALVAYNRAIRLDAEAPVVETCVKHPVTVSPFKPNY